MPSLTKSLLVSLLSAAAARAGPVDRRGGFGGATQNGLRGPCKPLTVVFARGTTEPGNVGSLVSPPLFQAVAARVGGDRLAAQGVDYAADVPGFLEGGDAEGSQRMADLVLQTQSKCPETKVVVSGYSQGGQLVHNAAGLLSPEETGAIATAVIFGDPFNGQPVQGVGPDRTRIYCHDTDDICKGGTDILLSHLNYGAENADEAADFIVKVTGL